MINQLDAEEDLGMMMFYVYPLDKPEDAQALTADMANVPAEVEYINDTKVYAFFHEGMWTVRWSDDKYCFIIQRTISKADAMAALESIDYINPERLR